MRRAAQSVTHRIDHDRLLAGVAAGTLFL